MIMTTLDRASAISRNPSLTEALVKAGAGLDARKEGGWAPLRMAAVFNENPVTVATLLEAGVDINARDVYDVMSLHWAARWSTNPAIINVLLEAGADVRALGYFNLTACDPARNNPALRGSTSYWHLRNAGLLTDDGS